MDSAGDLEIHHALAQQGILLGRQQDEIQASHQALTRLSQQLTVITQRLDQIQIDPSVIPAVAAPAFEETSQRLHRLAEQIKDEIYSQELPPSLDGLVELATRVDLRLALRAQHRYLHRRESFDLPSSVSSATSPWFGFAEEEPMQIGRAHLTARERRHRIAHGLCLYCGEAGHMITVCPHKRQPSSGERSRTVGVTAALLPSGGPGLCGEEGWIALSRHPDLLPERA